MTANIDQDTDRKARGNPAGRRLLLASAGILGLVVLAGIVTGFLNAMAEHGGDHTPAAYAILVVLLLAIVVLGWVVWRLWPEPSSDPIAPRVKRARNWTYAAVAIGAVLGLYIAVAGGPGSDALFSNGPVERHVALVVIFGWLILTPVLTFLWWRNLDEHEAGAYRDGALYAAHAYLFIVPAWWFAARADLLPPQDPMIVLTSVATIWSVVWLKRRYF